MRWSILVIAACWVFLVHCGAPPQKNLCIPGKVEPCACPRGEKGIQTCKADGSGFDACSCPEQEKGKESDREPATADSGKENHRDAGEPAPDGTPVEIPAEKQAPEPSSQNCQKGKYYPCYSGPPETKGKGPCTGGIKKCNGDGTWGRCEGEVLPTKESGACDGKDNDCDGVVDEGCGRKEPLADQESPAADAGTDSELPPEPIPDGICTPGLTAACYTGPSGTLGVGSCREGVKTCKDDRSWGACRGGVTPSSDICDGWDNDCDGQVDEGMSNIRCSYGGPAGTEGKGECRASTKSCVAGNWTACSGEVLPTSKEACGDGKDNDCNGVIDEGCPLPTLLSDYKRVSHLAAGPNGSLYALGAGASKVNPNHKGDIYFRKIGKNRITEWNLDFGGVREDRASQLLVDSGGNAYLLVNLHGDATVGGVQIWGRTQYNAGGTISGSGGVINFALVKVSPAGKIVWVAASGEAPSQQGFNTVSSVYGGSMAIDSSGNIYVSGGFYGQLDIEGRVFLSKGDYDIFVAKYSAAGKLAWVKVSGTVQHEGASCTTIDSKGSIHVSGWYVDSLDIQGKKLSGQGRRIFIAEFDSQGSAVRASTVTGSDSAAECRMLLSGAGGRLVLVGEGARDIGTHKMSIQQSFIVNLGAGHSISSVWHVGVSNQGKDVVNHAEFDSQGSLHLSGSYSGLLQLGVKTFPSQGGSDLFLAKIDTAGKTVYLETGGSPSNDFLRAFAFLGSDLYLGGEVRKGTIQFAGVSHIASNIEQFLWVVPRP